MSIFIFEGRMKATDPNNDKLLYYLECAPSKGLVEIKDNYKGSFIYTPLDHENGNDAFTFQVFDGQYVSESTPIFINIESINDNPIAQDLSIEVWESEEITFNLNAFDIDGKDEIIGYIIVQEPIDKDALTLNQSIESSINPTSLRRGFDPFVYSVRPTSPILSSGIIIVSFSGLFCTTRNKVSKHFSYY